MAVVSHEAPEFDDLLAAWPSEGKADLCRALGGNMATFAASPSDKTGALKVSVCLAATGFTLSNTSRYSPENLTDKDGKVMCVDAADLAYYLDKHLKKSHKLSRPKDMVAGKRGILYFKDNNDFDLFDVSKTSSPFEYWDDSEVHFWELA